MVSYTGLMSGSIARESEIFMKFLNKENYIARDKLSST